MKVSWNLNSNDSPPVEVVHVLRDLMNGDGAVVTHVAVVGEYQYRDARMTIVEFSHDVFPCPGTKRKQVKCTKCTSKNAMLCKKENQA